MKLFDLGHLPHQDCMLVFHALARMGVESLVIVSPEVPIVSVGYFQNAAEEVQLSYCRRAGLPVMRREVGGGTTYLDGNQVFYQLILSRGHPMIPKDIQTVYSFLSQPAIETYRAFGIETELRPISDIVTLEERKIADQGGGDIGECMVFVGSILLDFDYDTMVRILKAPDFQSRDKIHRSLNENLTTIRRELGTAPSRDEVAGVLVEKFRNFLGPMSPATLTPVIEEKMDELEAFFTSHQFLHLRRRRPTPSVTVRHGVDIRQGAHKAPGGVVRTTYELARNTISNVSITGDFTLVPKAALGVLESSLDGATTSEEEMLDRVSSSFRETEAQAPGISPKDVVMAFGLNNKRG